ncbi:glutaredoxin family protein [Erysipelothrix rhusiopathiae]|uniref:glutaredoxin family protein n=2 Tax=Erysipelothrix rhusiopathiae TaxID=1648 RepID=UPI000F455A3A|nr:glutaredoxin [Erysipelothrix rhusiopathiae]MDE8256258.1 glutaredoxin [Erysipelothrix rhusiopathiae]RNM29901.1 glutaredoxin [Erysipelothrix rhusiopathiae]
MTKIMMLTQDNCPKCMALKNYLELGLRNKYAEHIEVVKREDDPERFKSIALEYGIMATPVLIGGGEVLVDTNPSKVNAFFEKII